MLSEVYFHGRKPYGCALVSWRDLQQKKVMQMIVADLLQQQRFNYFLRATDDGLKRGSYGRYSKAWLAANRRVKKGASFTPKANLRRK